MKKYGQLDQKTKVYIKIFALFMAICLLIAGFSFQYYRRLHATIRDEGKGYLQEVARRIGSNIDRIIGDNFAVLYTMVTSLESMDTSSIGEVQELLQRQQSYWNYEKMMLVDLDGKAYDLNNHDMFVTFDHAVRADILAGQQALSTTQVINNKEYIIFSVPINNVEVEGKTMVALAAAYSPNSFDQVLSMTSFDEQAYSQIITKSGAIVIRSSSPYAIKSGYNIFSTLENAKFSSNTSLSKIRKDIEENQGDQAVISLDGTERYMVYTPIDPEAWYLLTFVPLKVVNEKSDMLLKSTLFLCGLITVTFAGLCSALFFIFNRNKRRLEQIAYVDEVTGGNTIQRFYLSANDVLKSNSNNQYALVYTNIEKFKVINEQMGLSAGDMLLKLFYNYINETLTDRECMGRLSADNFCILLEFKDEASLLGRFGAMRSNADLYFRENRIAWSLPVLEFGVYVIEDYTRPIPQMVDRAKLALRETSWSINSKFHYAFYDDGIRRQLFREKQLEDRMESALINEEFQVYLQPKYHLPEEKIGGAEALVRWVSTDEGMIFPNEFIPLFEKNGFIVELDLYVFEGVCRALRAWLDEGLTPVKISVNCSRIHFKTANFLNAYIHLADQYQIDRELVEIELTESVVFENNDQWVSIIRGIRDAGFGCSMDDFGSGYSSLNLIQTIPVDTLKLDKIFFHGQNAEARRTEAVVKNIVSLAKALSMETVAEGVEQREQVEMLKSAGCDYIQGYVFAKPMPIEAFKRLAFEENE